MKKYFITLVRWPAGCLIFFLAGCRGQGAYKKLIITKEDSIARAGVINRAFTSIALAGKGIKTGDLVTRTGNDFTSESLRSLNRRNTTYSHCGIASIENDSVFIYHALGGEWNPNQKIRRDPITYFADPFNNKGIGIFRFQIPDSIKKKLQVVIKDFYIHGIMFDMDFDLKTDDHMYCAEFVYKSFVKSSNGNMVFNHSFIKEFEFIGVDDLFLHPLCTLKQQIVYK